MCFIKINDFRLIQSVVFHKNIEFLYKVLLLGCVLISTAPTESKVVSARCKIELSRNGHHWKLIACKNQKIQSLFKKKFLVFIFVPPAFSILLLRLAANLCSPSLKTS